MSVTSERLSFPNGRGQELAAALERPAGAPRAAAVFAHCFTCSKDLGAVRRLSRALRERGFAVLRFDFTGLGNSEGDFANESFSSNVEDLVAAAGALRERGLAPELLVGHSLGGAAVLAAAGQVPDCRAVATIGAPADAAHVTHLFRDALDAIDQEGEARVVLAGREFRVRRHFVEDVREQRLRERVGELGRALLILHSPQDAVVGIDHARRLFEAARHPKSFVSLDGADHLLSDPRDAEYAAVTIAAWASRYLAAGAAPPAEAPPAGGPALELEDGEVLVRSLRASRLGQEVLVGPHRLVADEPASVGGDDAGPDPYELLLASLGACTSMTLRLHADRKGWPVESVAVRLRHDRIHAEDRADCSEGTTGRVDRIERVVDVRGDLSDEQRARLLEIAGRCPVHRTLLAEKTIPTRLA
jgi:putative redox protein